MNFAYLERLLGHSSEAYKRNFVPLSRVADHFHGATGHGLISCRPETAVDDFYSEERDGKTGGHGSPARDTCHPRVPCLILRRLMRVRRYLQDEPRSKLES